MKKWLWYWGPPVLWMITIFLLSARERTQVSEVYGWNFVFFKTLHVIEYAALYFLLFRAFLKNNSNVSMRKSAWAKAFIVAFLYAASDELHQTFVPTREGKPRDIAIDTIGMFLMYSYSKYKYTFVKRFLK